MDNFVTKQAIPIASKRKSKIDLSFDHYYTNDFFKAKVVAIKELVPGDSITLDVDSFCRTAPLSVPTFGKMEIHTNTFFVPMRIIFDKWNEYISNSIKTNVPITVPHCDTYVFSEILHEFENSQTVSGSTGYDYKIHVKDIGYDQTTYHKFTDKGRRVYDLLQSLGYRWAWDYDADAEYNQQVSLLPLLAFCKIYLDWYYPNSMVANEVISIYMNTNPLTKNEIATLLDLVVDVAYNKDFFTQIWQNPVGPMESFDTVRQQQLKIDDVTVKSGTSHSFIQHGSNNTPIIRGLDNTGGASQYVQNLSDYTLKALTALTEYMKRNQLSGFRAYERILTRYGKKLSDAEAKISLFLGSQKQTIEVSDVTSTSDTDNASLGQIAGKGIGYTNGKTIHFETGADFGYLITIQTIIPHTGYPDGLDKMMTHINPLDFFTPEFDNLGVDAVSKGNLFMRYNVHSNNDPLNYKEVFGFAPRFFEYKISNDMLTGDFIVNSKNALLSNYHFMRNLSDLYGNNQLKLNKNFVTGKAGPYDKIFNYTSTEVDHFFLISHVKLIAYRPMKSIVESFDWEDHSDTILVEGNGNQVN